MKTLIALLLLASMCIGQQVINLGGGCRTSYNVNIPTPMVVYNPNATELRVSLYAPGDFPESILFMDFYGSNSNVIPYPLPLTFLGLPVGCNIMLDPKYTYILGSVYGQPGDCEIFFPLVAPRPMYDIVVQFMILDPNSPGGFVMSNAVRCII